MSRHIRHAFQGRSSHEVVKVDPDAHLKLDENGEVMGIGIWNAGKIGLIKQVTKAIV
ncbi:DUF2283 domain-containing protein [Candidatus Bathyarchaeota archaeon]|nr:DUF2283 domain-containing protein [Candidatus Bathyarchaeota archaeon]